MSSPFSVSRSSSSPCWETARGGLPFAKDMRAEVEERDMVEEEGWREGWRARRKGWRGALETLRAEAAGEGGREGDGM